MYTYLVLFFISFLSPLYSYASHDNLSDIELRRIQLLLESQNQLVAEIDLQLDAYNREMPLIAFNMLHFMQNMDVLINYNEILARCGIGADYYTNLKNLVLERYRQEHLLRLLALDRKHK